MQIIRSKEWWLAKARDEGSSVVSAGLHAVDPCASSILDLAPCLYANISDSQYHARVPGVVSTGALKEFARTPVEEEERDRAGRRVGPGEDP
jgi:hypothetical protein